MWSPREVSGRRVGPDHLFQSSQAFFQISRQYKCRSRGRCAGVPRQNVAKMFHYRDDKAPRMADLAYGVKRLDVRNKCREIFFWLCHASD